MKYKMNKGEKKTDFATRLINEHGEFLSASEAYELIDKRTTNTMGIRFSILGWESFQANLSDAVRKGNLAKKRGEDSAGKRRVLYGPKGLELLYDPKDMAKKKVENPLEHWETPYKGWPMPKKPYLAQKWQTPSDFAERLADADKKDKPSIEDIPLGKLLEFNGTERDDIMSVIEDWLFDTSLRQLRDKYPILETYIKEMLR